MKAKRIAPIFLLVVIASATLSSAYVSHYVSNEVTADMNVVMPQQIRTEIFKDGRRIEIKNNEHIDFEKIKTGGSAKFHVEGTAKRACRANPELIIKSEPYLTIEDFDAIRVSIDRGPYYDAIEEGWYTQIDEDALIIYPSEKPIRFNENERHYIWIEIDYAYGSHGQYTTSFNWRLVENRESESRDHTVQ